MMMTNLKLSPFLSPTLSSYATTVTSLQDIPICWGIPMEDGGGDPLFGMLLKGDEAGKHARIGTIPKQNHS